VIEVDGEVVPVVATNKVVEVSLVEKDITVPTAAELSKDDNEQTRRFLQVIK
jgi:hypothetical protein